MLPYVTLNHLLLLKRIETRLPNIVMGEAQLAVNASAQRIGPPLTHLSL